MPDIRIIQHAKLSVEKFNNYDDETEYSVSPIQIISMSDLFYVSDEELELIRTNIHSLETKYEQISIVECYDTSKILNLLKLPNTTKKIKKILKSSKKNLTREKT